MPRRRPPRGEAAGEAEQLASASFRDAAIMAASLERFLFRKWLG
jgi:hypothetical protein